MDTYLTLVLLLTRVIIRWTEARLFFILGSILVGIAPTLLLGAWKSYAQLRKEISVSLDPTLDSLCSTFEHDGRKTLENPPVDYSTFDTSAGSAQGDNTSDFLYTSHNPTNNQKTLPFSSSPSPPPSLRVRFVEPIRSPVTRDGGSISSDSTTIGGSLESYLQKTRDDLAWSQEFQAPSRPRGRNHSRVTDIEDLGACAGCKCSALSDCKLLRSGRRVQQQQTKGAQKVVAGGKWTQEDEDEEASVQDELANSDDGKVQIWESNPAVVASNCGGCVGPETCRLYSAVSSRGCLKVGNAEVKGLWHGWRTFEQMRN